MLFLNLRERGGELATLRATGWGERAMSRLVGVQGAAIGAAGSLAGAALGLVAAALFAGRLPGALVATTTAAAAVGVLLAAVAAILPALWLRGLAIVPLLADD